MDREPFPTVHAKGLFYYQPRIGANAGREICADVVIYGATAAGIIAALQLVESGRTVAIAEFGRHIGGITCGGLGATDIGNKSAIGGMARKFYQKLGEQYGRDESWTFEPHVAERVFSDLLKAAGVAVYFEQHLQSVWRNGTEIARVEMEDGTVYRGRYYLDTSYEGDLMAKAGVSYTVGREANELYGETLNGIHYGHPGHNFNRFVDPFKTVGNPRSGLCWGISEDHSGVHGQGDRRIQAFNFRLCLTNRDENRVPFPCPADYDPERYEILRRYLDAGIWDALFLSKAMPNGKTDTNNFGAFSTDHIGANHNWPDGGYSLREEIFQEHVSYQMGLLYFLTNDPNIPAVVREDMQGWGLAEDEFSGTSGWPHALYVREARRMVADCVMTEHHAIGRVVEPDGIGLAAYQMDSHHCRRIVLGGRVYNEGNVEISGFGPYPISYRSICPKEEECTNLLVPWCLSASHIAFGSIRMEPVGMVLGQSAAIALDLALGKDVPVQQIVVEELQRRLREAGQVIDQPKAPFLRRFVGAQELL